MDLKENDLKGGSTIVVIEGLTEKRDNLNIDWQVVTEWYNTQSLGYYFSGSPTMADILQVSESKITLLIYIDGK